MEYRLPYYMAYPMPLQYDDARMERRDYEYMQSMYPIAAKKVLPYVEEECERMSYAGSVIYDEYPDQLQIRMMCNRVHEKIKKQEIEMAETCDWLRDMVQIVLYQELFRRRREYRKNRGLQKNEKFDFNRNACSW